MACALSNVNIAVDVAVNVLPCSVGMKSIPIEMLVAGSFITTRAGMGSPDAKNETE